MSNPARGTVTIAGTELHWDLTGLDIQKGPAERFPVGTFSAYRTPYRRFHDSALRVARVALSCHFVQVALRILP